MKRLLAAVRRSLGSRKSSAKVVDESAIEGRDPNEQNRESGGGWLAAVFEAAWAPLVAVSCFSAPDGDGAVDPWRLGELPRASEMDNYLIVRDSMRYAIYL